MTFLELGRRWLPQGVVILGACVGAGCGETTSSPQHHNGDDQNDDIPVANNDGGSGGTSAAGSSGGSPSNGTGGAPPGGSGSGGAFSSSGFGAIGEPCGDEGQIACSDSEFKSKLVCGASGEWISNGTCDGDQLCDPAEGVAQGTCQTPLTACNGREAGDVYCEGTKNYQCNERLLSSVEVGDCTIGCVDGECIPVADPCDDVGGVHSCSSDCDGKFSCQETQESPCSGLIYGGSDTWPAFNRIPAASELCTTSATGCEMGGPVGIQLNPGPYVKIVLPDDWLGSFAHYNDASDTDMVCGQAKEQGCMTLDLATHEGNAVALFFPQRADAAARNIQIEHSDTPLSCP